MLPDPDKTDLEPEASDALDQLRDGIARVRVIVREAKQAIGHAPPEGPLLPSDPDPEGHGPIIPTDQA